MENFYPYWRFFCGNTFAKDDKLYFYEDGSFAIMTADDVSLYSNEAKSVCRYSNAFLLPNGCICQCKENEIFVYFMEEMRYSIPGSLDTKFRVYKNAVEMIDINGNSHLHFIMQQFADYRSIALSERGLTVGDVSIDNKVLLCDASHTKKLQDKNGNVLLMGNGINRVDFLNGSYIVHISGQKNGSILYNSDNEPVLQSELGYGIRSMGDCVCYENALIADANGLFVSEYNHETAVYGNIHIFAYKVNSFEDKNTRFWPGGKMMCFRNAYLGTALCYWHNGHFYFAPQYLNMVNFERSLLGIENPFQHYLKRIQEIM